MSRGSDKPIIAVAVILIAIILVGEVIVYTSDYTDYSADAHMSGDDIVYTVSADGSKTYSVVVSDNGGYGGIERLYVYYDESYASNYEDVDVSIGAHALDQEYYLQQVVSLLGSRSVHDVSYVDASELADVLNGEISSDGCAGSGLLAISGALPDTVYTGNADDTILQWVSGGGSLYWLGNLLGAWYSTTEGLVEVDGDYQSLFLGAECLNTGDTSKAYSDIDSNGYRSALSLQSNDVKYGVDQSLLPADRRSLCIGFTEDGYASIAFVGCGAGSICVIGGDYSNYQRNDLVMVISAGIGPGSSIVAVDAGTVTNGTVERTMEGIRGSDLTAFIYLGGYYPVYAKLIRL